jgi:hypothetical protein
MCGAETHGGSDPPVPSRPLVTSRPPAGALLVCGDYGLSCSGGVSGIRCLYYRGPVSVFRTGTGNSRQLTTRPYRHPQALTIATVCCERGLCRQADTGCVSSETDTRAAVRHSRSQPVSPVWRDRCQSQTPVQMKVDCYGDHAAPPLVCPSADGPVRASQLGSDGSWGGRFRLQSFPAAPAAGRPGAGQASSPCWEGAGRGLIRQHLPVPRPCAPSSRRGVGRLSGYGLSRSGWDPGTPVCVTGDVESYVLPIVLSCWYGRSVCR